MRNRNLLPGLLLTLVIGTTAYVVWRWAKGQLQISPLLWAFLVSFTLGNTIRLGERFSAGIGLASSHLLRIAVASLGLVVSASAWWALGGQGIAIVLGNLLITVLVGYLVCRGLLRLTLSQTLLISTGTAICGASAIAAVGPAIDANEQDTALALSVVTLFGLAAMFLYPVLYSFTPLGAWLGDSPSAFGLWCGVGIHETAQVIAASSQVEGALELATLAKSVRIFMIGPVVLLASVLHRRATLLAPTAGRRAIKWPIFAIVFVALTFVHSALAAAFGDSWVNFSKAWLSPVVKFLLTWAFAAIGLRVRVSDLRAVGLRAFMAGLVVAATAGVTALLLSKLFWL
jgi:uncharacterized integral membrane protein (TIGR00698 family)